MSWFISSTVDYAISLGNLVLFFCLCDGSLDSTKAGLQFTEEVAPSSVALSVIIDIIYRITWIRNIIVRNGNIRFMGMTKVSHSSAIYGSVDEFAGVDKSLLDSPQVKELLINLEKL